MSYLIEQILKTKKITDYLERKGHPPVGGEVNGRLKYRCPLHEGDNTPSFMVYLNGDFQNFFCFGCLAKYHIIHLYRDLEHVTTRDAIMALGGDLKIDVESEINYAIEKIENDSSLRSEFNAPELALIISRATYDFLKTVKYKKDFVEATEKLNDLVNNALFLGDLDSLKVMADSVPDRLSQLSLKHLSEEQKNFT